MLPIDNEELRETTLSPEVRRIRNSIIKKFAHEPLDIMGKFVKDVVENEQDTVKRLGAMAARVEILRMRISQISDAGRISTFDELTEEEVEEHKLEENSNEIVITSPNLSDWVRLRIIENSEINGVRFPKGVVIDVSQEDGDRLLESGKASYVDVDEIADVKSDVDLQHKNDLKSAAKGNEDLTNEPIAVDDELSAGNEISATNDESKISKKAKNKTGEDSLVNEDKPSAVAEKSESTKISKKMNKTAKKDLKDTTIIKDKPGADKEQSGGTDSVEKELIEEGDPTERDGEASSVDSTETNNDQAGQSADDLLAGFELETPSNKND